MSRKLLKTIRKERRVKRVRKTMSGLPERPRLAVSRSNKNIYAQIIDDSVGKTICAAGTRSKDLKGQVSYGGNVSAAAFIGKTIGEKAKSLGIEQVCFDRRGFRFHGRVKALAEAAREAGLKF